MHYFLVIYDRREGQILQAGEYRKSSGALQARFEAERRYNGDRNIEVVVLGANSWESLFRTHSRYFKRVQDLAQTALDRVTG
jgi:hypothetical protein